MKKRIRKKVIKKKPEEKEQESVKEEAVQIILEMEQNPPELVYGPPSVFGFRDEEETDQGSGLA